MLWITNQRYIRHGDFVSPLSIEIMNESSIVPGIISLLLVVLS